MSQSKILVENHCIWSHCELLLPWTKFSHAPQQQQRAAALRTGWWEKKKLISALCTFWRQNVNQCDDGLDRTSEWIMLLHHWKRNTYSSFGYITFSTIYILYLLHKIHGIHNALSSQNRTGCHFLNYRRTPSTPIFNKKSPGTRCHSCQSHTPIR